MKTLTALKTKSYAGKRLQAGKPFDVNDKDVRILKALGWAKDFVPPPLPRPKKTVAEASVAVPAPPPPAPEPAVEASIIERAIAAETAGEAVDDEATKGRRGYKRRDMTAEPGAAG